MIIDDPDMHEPTKQELLLLLFHLSTGGAASKSALQAHLGCDITLVERLLGELRALGWIHDERVRLTMSGLVIASAIRAEVGRNARHLVADAQDLRTPLYPNRFRAPSRRCVDGCDDDTQPESDLGARLVRRTERRFASENRTHDRASALQSVA